MKVKNIIKRKEKKSLNLLFMEVAATLELGVKI